MDGGFVPDQGDHGSQHQRGDPRDSMLLQATLRIDAAGVPQPLRVRNLSAGGLMGEGKLPLAVGKIVSVELRNIGLVTGRIAWIEETRFGIAFDEAIDPQLARKPVGTKVADSRLVPPFTVNLRRPGVRPE